MKTTMWTNHMNYAWKTAPYHPWGDILVWLWSPHSVYSGHEKSTGGGWGINPHYQDQAERYEALIEAYSQYYKDK